MNHWKQELQKNLFLIKEKNRYRTLKYHQGIDVSSNDYLSLNEDGLIHQWMQESIQEIQEGGATGSRLIRGHYKIFEELEDAFRKYTGYESSLFFHSGYAANLTTIPAFISSSDVVFCDRLCHATILDGIRLSGARRYYFRHNDMDDLESKIKKYGSSFKRRWILTESVFSMDGDTPDLSEIIKICNTYNCFLYIDEAHAIGLFGENGAGLTYRYADQVAIAVYPLGKAPGFQGAFVCGNQFVKETLINQGRGFIFTTAQPPFHAYVMLKILKYLQSPDAGERRNKVLSRASDFCSHLKKNNILTTKTASPIIPVITGSEESALSLSEILEKNGFDVRAIRPPTVPPEESRLRLSLHYRRTEEELSQLLNLITAHS